MNVSAVVSELCESDSSDDEFFFGSTFRFLTSSDSSSSSDTDDDEEPPRTKRQKIDVTDIFLSYSPEKFLMNFRVSRKVFDSLCEQFKNSIMYRELLGHSFLKTPEFHILLFLWYAGNESAGFHNMSEKFDCSVSTVHLVIKRVTYFISSIAYRYIVWPEEEEQMETADYFFNKYGFPGIIGCVDGIHVKIDPVDNNKEESVNKKKEVVLHVQGICNEKNKFIHVFAGSPGSAADADVWEKSDISTQLTNLDKDRHLLGSSTYPCSEVVLTPYCDYGCITAAQEKYNIVHNMCHITIEETFMKLKQRFCQLYHCKLRGKEYIAHFIRACCVLHNMCDLADLEAFNSPKSLDKNDTQLVKSTFAGERKRDNICARLFVNLR